MYLYAVRSCMELKDACLKNTSTHTQKQKHQQREKAQSQEMQSKDAGRYIG